MTPKQSVLNKYPQAELVRDGARDLGNRGIDFFDFAIYTKPGKKGRYIAQGATPQQAWRAANGS